MAEYRYITSQGVIVADTAETRQQIEDYWKSQFGADLPTNPETPQGVIITAQTMERDGIARNNAELANQINPDIATDLFLESIGWLFGAEKFPATRSIIYGVTVAGKPNTVIPRHSQAKTSLGHVFRTRTGVQLDASGSAVVDFESVELGPIPAIAGALNKIVQSVYGWETVNNTNPAVVGRIAENDVQFRKRRRETLATNNISTSEAIISALYSISGVTDVAFLENTTSAPATINGITLAPHSVWVSILADGAVTNEQIATALANNKTDGAGWNGAVTYSYLDPHSGQTSTIKWDVPAVVQLYVRITVKISDLDVTRICKDAVLAYQSGNIEGEAAMQIGGEVSPFEISGAINQVEPRVTVNKVELSIDGGSTWSTSVVSVDATEILRASESTISVVQV